MLKAVLYVASRRGGVEEEEKKNRKSSIVPKNRKDISVKDYFCGVKKKKVEGRKMTKVYS